MIYGASAAVVVFLIVVGYACWKKGHRITSRAANNLTPPFLFVTAHPDDECLFFTPSILSLVELHGSHSIHLLCISNGSVVYLIKFNFRKVNISRFIHLA